MLKEKIVASLNGHFNIFWHRSRNKEETAQNLESTFSRRVLDTYIFLIQKYMMHSKKHESYCTEKERGGERGRERD
jgi:hypothetical protein